jgi:hypothetical protein
VFDLSPDNVFENGDDAALPIDALFVTRPRDVVSPYSNQPLDITPFDIIPIPLQRALLFVTCVADVVTTRCDVGCCCITLIVVLSVAD